MSVATLRSDPDECAAVHGVAEIGYVHSGLEHLFQHDPLRVLFPAPPMGEIPTAVIVTTSGGLVGGDRLDVTATAGPGASVLICAQAAEKVYRSTGADCRIDVSLGGAENSWLEWLPQETILFETSRMRRLTRIDVKTGGRLMAGEMLVFGRRAFGETLTSGLIRDAWEVRRDGRLLWADALHMDGGLQAILLHPGCFDGAESLATLIYLGDDPDANLDIARLLAAECEPGLRIAFTVVNGVLVGRWLGSDAFQLRRSFGEFWRAFRNAVADLPAALPRIWNI